MAHNLRMRKIEHGTSCVASRCHFVMNLTKLPTRKTRTIKVIHKRAPNEVRTRDLTLTKRMLCQLSYEGIKRISNPYWDFHHGLDSRPNIRRQGIGAITSCCGPKNLGMTPNLGIFFHAFAKLASDKSLIQYRNHRWTFWCCVVFASPGSKNVRLSIKEISLGVEFEPTPPKWSMRKTGHLDRWAVQPHRSGTVARMIQLLAGILGNRCYIALSSDSSVGRAWV